MTRRMWQWTSALTIVGAALLGFSISDFVSWHKPAGTPQVITIGQLLGIIASGCLFAIAATVASVGWRRRHVQRRYERRVAAAQAEYDARH